MELRPYQVGIVGELRQLMSEGHHSILAEAPTGSGKTVLASYILNSAASKGMDSWFIVHRRELIKQSIRTFSQFGIRHGVIAAGFDADASQRVQIASVATLINRYQKLRRPRLIIWDEAHHITAGMWAEIFSNFPDAFHIGLTATPERLDGRGLGDYFKKMVKGPSIAWLISEGYLSPYKAFAPSMVDSSNLHTRMGDFIKAEVNELMNKPTITGDAIREYIKRASGKRNVIFAASIEHSKNVVAQYNASGFKALHADGETPSDIRDQSIKLFERGDVTGLSNVDLFGEGFDLPAIEVLTDLAPTQSLGRAMQRWGRVLRPIYAPGFDLSTKDGRLEAIAKGPKPFAIILYHAGNIQRHGLPDEERTWSLDGRDFKGGKGGNKEKLESVKICPACFAAQISGRPNCIYCNHEYEVNSRKIAHNEGDLAEITADELAKRRAKRAMRHEQVEAGSLQALIELGKKRKLKNPYMWAKHVFNGRQAKKLRKGR